MCKTIKQKVKFKAPPKIIYDLLADSKKHSRLTGEKAVIGKKAGTSFSTGAGYAKGINVDLVPGQRIVQAWRAKNFPVGIFSMASFVMKPAKNGGTELTLTHRGVPKELIPEIESYWRDLYWQKIRNLKTDS